MEVNFINYYLLLNRSNILQFKNIGLVKCLKKSSFPYVLS
jgi:hypothetical protein